MNRKSRISVVLNFLNAEQFLREAIESVLSQTYHSWELFLVDDGSSDTSTEIAQGYALKFPQKVHYLEHGEHQNKGASASRNLGSSNASGEYIAFLDADDVWLPHKLEQQVAILEAHPEAAMVYGSALYWYSWTGNSEDIHLDYVQEIGVKPNTLIEPPTLLTTFLQNQDATPFPSSILVRRTINTAIRGFEEGDRSIYDDQVYCAKIGLEAPVFACGECWHRYRQHPNQRTVITGIKGQYPAVRLNFLNWLQDYLSGRGVNDGEVWSVLQKERWPYRHPKMNNLVGQVKKLVKWVVIRLLPSSLKKRLQFPWLNQ